MSFFKEQTSASVPKPQCKWLCHQLLGAVDFDGLRRHNQISDQWKGETWSPQHTRELPGKKEKSEISLFKVPAVSLKEWIFLTGTGELKGGKERNH